MNYSSFDSCSNLLIKIKKKYFNQQNDNDSVLVWLHVVRYNFKTLTYIIIII